MIQINKDSVNHETFQNLSGFTDLISFTSTKENGNMANYTSTSSLRSYLESLNIPLEQCIFAEQVHGKGVGLVAKIEDTRLGFNSLNVFPLVDALITNTKGLCLVIKTADCVPLTIYDPVSKAVGLVHAGWKGTLAGITSETIKLFKSSFNSRPDDLIVGIGPSIGFDDYMVKDDVAFKFSEMEGINEFLVNITDNQWKLDLVGLNKKQLIGSGVKNENIELSGISTFSSDQFFSFRKNKTAERFITGAVLL